MTNAQEWHRKRSYSPEELDLAKAALADIRAGMEVQKALRRHPLPEGRGFLAKHTLVAAYRELVDTGEWPADGEVLARIRMKPVRTLSGVTTITVLTKPFPCPGECIFCPTEADMPQSYLPDEPGARRGLENEFDPYRQVSSRLKALREVGPETAGADVGMWDVVRAVSQYLDGYCPDLNLRDHAIVQAIIKGSVRYDGRTVSLRDLIEETVKPLAAEVIAKASPLWDHGSRLDEILISGGGAYLLGPHIREYFKRARIVADPVFANASGYWRFCQRVAMQ